MSKTADQRFQHQFCKSHFNFFSSKKFLKMATRINNKWQCYATKGDTNILVILMFCYLKMRGKKLLWNIYLKMSVSVHMVCSGVYTGSSSGMYKMWRRRWVCGRGGRGASRTRILGVGIAPSSRQGRTRMAATPTPSRRKVLVWRPLRLTLVWGRPENKKRNSNIQTLNIKKIVN